MHPPVIGITLRPQAGDDGEPPRLLQNRSYISSLECAGGVPLPIPLLDDLTKLRVLYDHCDALCLPGGPDVTPEHYGQTSDPACGVHADAGLDRCELQLLEWAIADDKPVLAICRGVQLLNVACGGTLWQDINVQGATATSHREPIRDRIAHELLVVPGSHLACITRDDRVGVNTMHHQAIRDVAPSLTVSGHSDDGLVEAVEMPSRRFILGVQSHPEELTTTQPWARALFSALVAAAGATTTSSG